MHPPEKFAPLRKGLLEFVILKLIDTQQLYVAEMLKRLADTQFATQEGTLYPLLSKMRREDLVDYEWRESDSGPPRKYYRLTEHGRLALGELQAYWHHLNDTIRQLGH
jgi:PadR family transcriptional regulator, regulatory protein PadR